MRLLRSAVVIVVCTLTVVGCATPKPKLEPEVKVYSVAFRQSPPDPVYNRLRWVHPPQVLPAEEPARSDAMILPILQFDFKNGTLEQAAKVLAASAKYHSFTSSAIAHNKISLRKLGTIDELGEAIARQAGIRVVVDHELREVRFLPEVAETPEFFGPKE